MQAIEYVHTAVTEALFHAGLLYAAVTALDQRRVEKDSILIAPAALKLWVVLGFLSFLSCLGLTGVPLFAEFRVIFVYLLLFAPPASQEEIYDKAFAPLLLRIGTWIKSVQSSTLLSRRLSLFVVAQCTNVSLVAMNYARRHSVLEEDAIADITGGLIFTQRALGDVAQAERDKAKMKRGDSPPPSPPPLEKLKHI